VRFVVLTAVLVLRVVMQVAGFAGRQHSSEEHNASILSEFHTALQLGRPTSTVLDWTKITEICKKN
jgi:hypothetical protein